MHAIRRQALETHVLRRTFTARPDQHWYEPSKGHGLRHNPFNSIVSPRPIGWISSKGSTGSVNLAPYSFFNCFNYHPPIIGFSSIGWKDTVRNCSESGEFTWNLATISVGEGVNTSCEPVGPEVNEFELAGLTQVDSNIVGAPRVGESPVNFECKVTQIEQLKDRNGLIDTWMVLGEVIGVHINKDLIKGGVYDAVLAEPILRGGGPADYFSITRDNLFQIHRKHGHLEDPGIVDEAPNPL
jgi:flavin reductase (DIM6/NTAB) family NADH-FMN oxidoreductase RutF